MAKHARQPTHEEMVSLAECAHLDDAFARGRASVILLSLEGKGAVDIAHAVTLSARHVRNVIDSFNKHGMQVVQRRRSSGRPRSLTDSQRSALLDLLERQPRDFGMERNTWTLQSLVVVLRSEGVCDNVSKYTIQREVKRSGIDWAELKLRGIVRIPAGTEVGDGRSEVASDGSSISRGPYTNRMLRLGERELYDEIIESLKNDYAVTGNAFHLELTAIYSVKLIGAQTDGDWEQAERFDRMMHTHLKELKAAKKKQESQQPQKTGDTPAEGRYR